jgi:hypothetical protein
MKPRLLPEAYAAAYSGLDITRFRGYVAAGILPPPLADFDGMFDLQALDIAFDKHSDIVRYKAQKPAAAEPAVPPEDVFLTVTELSERWRLSEQSLANLRTKGEGIPYTKLPSGSIRYRLSDVLDAERDGTHGFTWAALAKALKSFRGLAANQRQQLLHHLRMEMRLRG